MTNKEKEKWLNEKTRLLTVAKQYYHHHAYEIVNTHEELKDDLVSSLNSAIEISPRIKKTKTVESKAIEAKKLNEELRKLLDRELKAEVKLEVNEENGVFYFSSNKGAIGGFDFAVLNHTANLVSLRNLCFGEIHYDQGQSRWDDFLLKNPDLVKIAKKLKKQEIQGVDLKYDSTNSGTPLFVGEIQFGNWALAYRDFFKVLKANVQNSIDCLIYIVPTGELETMLSDGIVTFDKTERILKDFAKVISVPVWLIGIDFS